MFARSLPRFRLRALACTLTLFTLALAGCSKDSPPEAPLDTRPNIIVVVVDTLRYDALRAYDGEAQPLDAVDAFSEQAAVFENALAPSSWTLPSIASLLTGMYPDRHGTAHPKLALRPDVTTIATAAHDAGYETVAFSDGAYVSPQFGLANGFDWFNDTSAAGARALPGLPRDGRPNATSGATLFDRAFHYLRSRKAGDPPFFMLVHTYSVHDYFREHPWAVGDIQDRPQFDENAIYCLISRKFCPEGIWDYFRALYDAEVRHMNEGFRTLMATVREQGIAPSTYILFTADHGEGFEPERDRVHHGGRLHEDVIRIPFMLTGPGISPMRIADPVSLVDVMPTMLDILELPVPSRVEGVSLMPRLNGIALPDRPLFALEYFYWWQDGERRDVPSIALFPLAEGVLSGGRWFTRHQSTAEVEDIIPGTAPLAPGSLNDTVTSMRQILRDRDTRLRPGDSRAEDEELQEKLRSLGYVN